MALLREEKQVVIKAIADLGHRVTAADVASKTGLSLTATTAVLNTIASETGGHLEVSEAGDIAYRFKNTFQSTYLTTGIAAFFARVFKQIFAIFFYLLKISFGIFLCFSLIIVVAAFVALTVIGGNLDSERENFRIGEIFEFFSLLMFRDLIFWGTTGTLRLPGTRWALQKPQASGKGNFFINCFSFLFGDGDPNAHIDEEKWRLAAQTIRDNGGVVIKEQLAPYLGADLDDEDSILPILTRFEGRPVVTAKGRIAYIFPSLQVTTDTTDAHVSVDQQSQDYLKENIWKFTNLSKEALKRIYLVAGINLFGTWWMYIIFIHILHFRLVWTLVLVAYATMFVMIPVTRRLQQMVRNREINSRNAKRAEAARRVREPDEEMKQKLAERDEFAPSLQIRAVDSDNLVYSTDADNLEQEFQHNKENQ